MDMEYRQFKVGPDAGIYPQYPPSLTNYGGRVPGYSMNPVRYPWYDAHRPSATNWKWGPDPYGYYRFKLWQQACAISQRQAGLRHTLMGPQLTSVPHSYPLSSQYHYPAFAQYPVNAIPLKTNNMPEPTLVCPSNTQDNSSPVIIQEQQPNYSQKYEDNKEPTDLHRNSSLSLSSENQQSAPHIPNPSLFRPYAKSDHPIQISDAHVHNLNTAAPQASNFEIPNPSYGTIRGGFNLQPNMLASLQYNSGDSLHMCDQERLLKPTTGSGKLVNVVEQQGHPKSTNFEGTKDTVATSIKEHQNHWNGNYQNQISPIWNKPVSTPVLELMNNIMQGRGSNKNQGLTNDLLDFAPALALDLLEEECTFRFRHGQLEDTVSANLDLNGLKGDRDLEELIMMDTELDQILESIDRQDEIKNKGEACEKIAKVVKHTKRQKIKHLCEICGKKFSCRANKTVHMRIHSGEKPYECEYCCKRFKQRSTMSTHIRIHTGDKPYVCDVCDRAFSDYSSWRKHLRVHSGEKPFSCSVCNKRFVQAGNRDRHMKRHVMNAKKILKRSR